MTFDLDAARALHDRDAAHSPYCASRCTDEDTNPHNWPCPTAIALGATGRTEWTGPNPDALRRVHIPRAGWYHIGPELSLQPDTTTTATFDTYTPDDALRDAMAASLTGTGTLYVPKIIEFDPDEQDCTHCGHVMGNHINRCAEQDCHCGYGDPQDPSNGPTNRNGYKVGDCDNQDCDGPHGHPGPCGIHNATDTCGAHRPDYDSRDYPCVLLLGHAIPHLDREGDRWNSDGNEGIITCNSVRPVNALTIPNTSPCTLPEDHRDPHTDNNGRRWDWDGTELQPTPGPNTPLCTNPSTTPGDRTHDNHWNRCTRRQSSDPEARRCILDTNHINQHEYHDTIGSGGRCTASRERPGVSRITCALDNGHATRYHVSPAGIHWGTNPNGPDAPTPLRPNADNPCGGKHGHFGRHCVFIHGHTGDHHYHHVSDNNTPCTAAHGGRTRCILPDTHIGAHRDLNGDTL